MSYSNAYIARTILFFVVVTAGEAPFGCRNNESNRSEPATPHSKGVDDYLKNLESNSVDMRKRAIAALSRMKLSPESEIWRKILVAVDAVAKGDVDAGVREKAMEATVRIVCGWKVTTLRNHPDHQHRAAAAWDLGFSDEFRQQEAEGLDMVVTALIQALSDKAPFVRGRAAEALQKFAGKAKRAVPALIRSLRDPDTWVRNRAAYALGDMKDPRAINALIANLDDKEPTSRSAAADALGLIGGIGAKVALPRLQAALRDQDEDVREAAEEAIYLIRKICETQPASR